VESIVLIFPIMILCHYAFVNLHDEVMLDMQNNRALRQVMLSRHSSRGSGLDFLDPKYSEHFVSGRSTDKLPERPSLASSLYQDQFPDQQKLNFDKLTEIPTMIMDEIYEPKTVTLIFDYQVNNKLFNGMLNKRKQLSASILIPGRLRKRGREVAAILGIGAAFYK